MSDSRRNHRQPAGLIFCAFFTFAAMVCAGTYSGGSGTAEDPYQISTVADWQELSATPMTGKSLYSLNDLDFEGVTVNPIGYADFDQEGQIFGIPFTGIFDGNGFTIRNLIHRLRVELSGAIRDRSVPADR